MSAALPRRSALPEVVDALWALEQAQVDALRAAHRISEELEGNGVLVRVIELSGELQAHALRHLAGELEGRGLRSSSPCSRRGLTRGPFRRMNSRSSGASVQVQSNLCPLVSASSARMRACHSEPLHISSGSMSNVEWVRELVCEGVIHEAESSTWVFRFKPGVSLEVRTPWRVIGEGRIKLGYQDHGQWFGLPQPVDGISRAMELLRDRPIREFSVATVSADATIDFGDGILLEIFNSSAGYEGWEMGDLEGRQIIAMGGGDIALFRCKQTQSEGGTSVIV